MNFLYNLNLFRRVLLPIIRDLILPGTFLRQKIQKKLHHLYPLPAGAVAILPLIKPGKDALRPITAFLYLQPAARTEPVKQKLSGDIRSCKKFRRLLRQLLQIHMQNKSITPAVLRKETL